MERRLTPLDHCIAQCDRALRTLFAPAPPAGRPYPGSDVGESPLAEEERRHAAGLMRVNHAGEICAQALYHGQASTARESHVREQFEEAAREEADHLNWCKQRLSELGDRTSLLDPLWYTGSFAIGAGAGLAGDRWSLGFVVETERQVEAHLGDHLDRLPPDDKRSRAVVRQMQEDEARHGRTARKAGGQDLPRSVQEAMRLAAGVMKFLAYRI